MQTADQNLSTASGEGWFKTTHWSGVLQAGTAHSPQADAAVGHALRNLLVSALCLCSPPRKEYGRRTGFGSGFLCARAGEASPQGRRPGQGKVSLVPADGGS